MALQSRYNLARTSQWITRSLTNYSDVKDYFEPLAQIFNRNWRVNAFRAQVVENRTESEHVYSLSIKPQRTWPTFVAGQFIEVMVEINGVRYSRIFSISSSPAHHLKTGLIELTIRAQDHGKVTPWLSANLQKGSNLHLSAAQGEFTLPRSKKQPLLMIAAGSGITPFRSQLQQLALEYPEQNVHLMYFNRGESGLFNDELQQLTTLMPNFSYTPINTASDGRISAAQLSTHCPDFKHRMSFICGPQGLITTAQELLQNAGVSFTNIQFELFGPKPLTSLDINTEGTVTFSSSRTHIENKATTSLLELAEAKQINAPSGCRMGVCHQCKCRKQQGVVYNTLTERYSDTGAEDIQLCVSVPVGDVTLNL